jgi:uncharacterized cupin superfamily protein
MRLQGIAPRAKLASMRKANISEIPEEKSGSPSGKFCTIDKPLNQAIGGDSRSMDLTKRWPFDVELSRIPLGAANYPFHCHSAQCEFYLIVSGNATVRHKDGEAAAVAGDFFRFGPGEPHQLINKGTGDVTYYCIADNPINDHAYYPDSNKWSVQVPERSLIKGNRVDYYDGEDEAK